MYGIEDKELVKTVISLLKAKPERSPGKLTVTKCVCCPRKTCYKIKGIPEMRTDTTELFFARGRGHHGVLEVFPNKEIELKKTTNCGETVWAHVDMKSDRIIEVFTTAMSANHVKADTPEKAAELAKKIFPLKYNQMRAYCDFAGEFKGSLLIFFLMGDYSRFDEVAGRKVYRGIQPQLRAFTYDFEPFDLNEIWEKINNNVEEIKLFQETGELPLTIGEKFECKSCGFAYACLSEEPVGESTTDIQVKKDDFL